MTPTPQRKKQLIIATAVVAILGVAVYAWYRFSHAGPGDGFASGNGRIEATEIDVATKLPGRVSDVLIDEGALVKAGQVLAKMDTASLEAQYAQAQATERQAHDAQTAAEAQVALREADARAADSQVALREAELDAATRRFKRAQALAGEGAASQQELDDTRASTRGSEAAVAASKSQAIAARAAIDAARAQLVGSRSSIEAAAAAATRIKSDIDDSVLTSPRSGRVQFKVAEPGEVLGAGGRVLNLVDLSDVYITFFLPEKAAGKVKLGSEVRIVLDAMPDQAIPAKVTFVADVAQFTPKSVETASERQKLMFRVKARIDRDVLEAHMDRIKTGVPGVAWVRLDASQPWPASLSNLLKTR